MAKIRAIIAADLLPRERASADALVMTAWLSARQRARYAPSLRSSSGIEEFAEHLADERRVVLEEGTDPVADEHESAAQAEKRAGQLPLRVLEALLLLAAVAGLVLLAVGEFRSSSSTSSMLSSPETAVTVAAAVVAAALLAALIGAIATRRRDRILLDWAVSRPGQLGRGLPLRRPLQGSSIGPAMVATLAPVLLIGGAVLGIVVGAALLLITLLAPAEGPTTDWSLWLFAGSAGALVLAVVLVQLRSRQRLQILRRSRAQEWIGPEGRTEEPPAV